MYSWMKNLYPRCLLFFWTLKPTILEEINSIKNVDDCLFIHNNVKSSSLLRSLLDVNDIWTFTTETNGSFQLGPPRTSWTLSIRLSISEITKMTRMMDTRACLILYRPSQSQSHSFVIISLVGYFFLWRDKIPYGI